MQCHLSALIPEDYLGDVHQRLLFYKKIANEVFGTTKFTTKGHSYDLNDEWKRNNRDKKSNC